MKTSTLHSIIRTVGFIFCPAFFFVSCDDTTLYEDVDIAIERCQADSLKTIEAKVIGQVDYFRRDILRQLPVEMEDGLILFNDYGSHQFFYSGEEQYTFDQGPCFQYVANEQEVIVRNCNTFYRYSPSNQELTEIYKSDNFVMDFSLTPDHGLCILEGEGYFPDGHQDKWLKYYNFASQSVETILHYDEIIRYSAEPLRAISSYIEDGIVYANLHTHHPDPEVHPNSSMFHRINVTQKKIEHQIGSAGTTIHIKDNFDNSSMFTVTQTELADWKLVDVRFEDLSEINSYPMPEGNYTRYSHNKQDQYLAQLQGEMGQNKEMSLINWRTDEVIFETIIERGESFMREHKVHPRLDGSLVYHNHNNNTATVYNEDGCIAFELIAEQNIDCIFYAGENYIVGGLFNDDVVVWDLHSPQIKDK